MFSSSKKFLMPSRASRAEKKGWGLWPSSGTSRTQAADRADAAVERVRLAMSGAMQACLDGDMGVPLDEAQGGRLAPMERVIGRDNAQVDALQRQLRSARDLDTLWYLRPGLMNVIAVRQGEVAARDCLIALTALFKHAPTPGRSARPGAF